MKTFIVLLILSNIAYFGWNQGWLRDLPQESVPVAANTAKESMPAFEQAPQRLVLLAEMSSAQEQAQSGEEFIVPPQNPGSELINEQDTAAITPEAATTLTTAPTAPAEDIGLQTAQAWCADIGLFEEEASAQALIVDVEAFGVVARLQAGVVPVSSTFWVHLPPFASQSEALQMVQELQENNIDSYYMRSGALAGGVSMGVFSREESAEVAKANFARRGYATEIGEVFREDTRFWLSLRADDALILESPEWQAFRDEHNELEVTENVCEVVASRTQFP